VIVPAAFNPDALKRPWLIGFGTLLSSASLARDIGDSATAGKMFYPIEVPGYKRLFNVQPDHYESSHVLSTTGIETGAMNVQPSPGHSFNGVLFHASEEELVRLDQRERYYDRVPVPISAFGSDHTLGEAFVYSAKHGSQWVVDDLDRLLPRWLDIELGRTGSYRISSDFGRAFDQTTFLADGETLVLDRYAHIEDYTRILQRPSEESRVEGTP
jgi:hypothetical protein